MFCIPNNIPESFEKTVQFGTTNVPFKLTDTAREMACYIEEKLNVFGYKE